MVVDGLPGPLVETGGQVGVDQRTHQGTVKIVNAQTDQSGALQVEADLCGRVERVRNHQNVDGGQLPHGFW